MYKIGNIVHDIMQDEDVIIIIDVSDKTNPPMYLVLNHADDQYYVSGDDIELT
jgi:hypothetical protein